MNRRELCKRVGVLGVAGLTGCTTSASPQSNAMLRTVTIESEDSLAEIDSRIEASLVDGEITRETTAVIELSLVNTGSTERTYTFDGVPFGVLHSDPKGWMLPHVTDEPAQKVAPECWEKPEDVEADAYAVLPTGRTLAPGEAVSQRYEFWSDTDGSTDCMPTGRYEFTGVVKPQNADTVHWSFTTRIE